MGKFTNNNGFSGVVGPVVGYSWRGKPCVRSKSQKSKNKVSPKQLVHQAKFGMVSKVLYSMRPLLDKTFKNFAIHKTGTNAAMSYNFKNCVSGVYPAFFIDYSLVLVSRGDLPNVADPVAAPAGSEKLVLTWIDNSGTGQAKPTDKCIAVAYCPELNCSLYSDGDTTRKNGNLTLDAPQLAGKTVETWLVIISANEAEVANSIYTGQVVIS